MFRELGEAIREEVVLHLFHAELAPEDAAQLEVAQAQDGRGNGNLQYQHETLAGASAIAAAGAGEAVATAIPSAAGVVQQQTVRASEIEKLGRNDPCWCGSGKKFKKCHGA
jgi:preprotein translocase subunit SecA